MLPQAKEDQSHQKLKEARRVLSSSLRREHSPLLTPWTSEKISFLFSTTQVGVICYSSCRRLIEPGTPLSSKGVGQAVEAAGELGLGLGLVWAPPHMPHWRPLRPGGVPHTCRLTAVGLVRGFSRLLLASDQEDMPNPRTGDTQAPDRLMEAVLGQTGHWPSLHRGGQVHGAHHPGEETLWKYKWVHPEGHSLCG